MRKDKKVGGIEMKMPIRSEADRCFEIRKRGKRGIGISRDDERFCLSMIKKYPDWYDATEAKIWNETLPFGSRAYREEPILPPYQEG